jgi:16S rRNA (uracil1498-N3)-methyltransferase
MQRYFIRSEQFQDQTIILDGEEAHHLLRVMRARTGDRFIVSDGERLEALAELTRIDKDAAEACVVQWLAMDQEPIVKVSVAQSLPKGDKLEMVIQKGTELGACRFIPFISERTVVQYDERKEAKRLERWRKIAKEAAEQAHRNRVPQVEAPVSWKQLLEMHKRFDLALMCYEQVGGSAALRSLLQQLREDWNWRASAVAEANAAETETLDEAGRSAEGPSVLLIVGPEGGFSEREAEQAAEAGIHLVGLGKRILRTETAGLAGLACIMYEFNEMGGAL